MRAMTESRTVWLLNDVYDVEHQAYLMSEKKMELMPLKIRSHGASTAVQYDERYTPYIEMTGLLPFIQLVSRSTPNLNAAAITALIDRWRPEIHSFHLRTGEMTVTLQDVSMITALPVEWKPLCMSTDSEGWRQQMEALIGMSPPEPKVEDGGKKDRVPAGAPFTWIAVNFAHCPEDANDELDDACRRSTKDGGVGGCMLLLSIWSWERLPVGRPKAAKWNTWDDHGNPVRLPNWAYKWDVVSEVASEVNLLCKQYTNEMDSLTAEQVNISELTPSFCFEFHPPHRVMHQSGLFQPHPPEWVDTDTQLHRLDRRRQRKIKDWHKHHKNYVTMFEQSVQAATSTQGTQTREHCPLAFNNYVIWFRESTRVEICPPAYEEDILEEPTEYDALAHGEYNRLIREGYQTSFAPVLNFVRKEVKKQADETEAILDKTPGGKKGRICTSTFHKDDSTSSGARMDDGDITSAAHLEDDVDTPEVADEMTLKAFQRSTYMLKPRKEFRRYSRDDYAHKGKNPVAGGSRLSRMRSMDDEDDDDDDDELDEPEPFVVVRRKKLASKRGRGPKM
ncbi:hypothetical protein D1007_36048 [Hordeum vulgare]|nr:hypothetical protein D1007_36048 [Hordeum vulgare]